MSTRHFLTLLDFSPAELRAVIDRSIAMKAEHEAGNDPQIFRNKVLG
jgi:ornithine carbamoyltransferase